MPASIRVNGVDLATLGVYVADAESLGRAPERSPNTVALLGRMGSLLTSPVTSPSRTVTLVGSIDPAARTVAALFAAIDVARDLFHSGRLALTLTDTAGNTRRLSGFTTRFDTAPRLSKQHFQAASVADVRIAILCDDPTARSVEPSLLSLPAGVRVPVPLGTAPSTWIGRAMGSDPVLTYRSAGGAALWAVGLTRTITTNEDWFDVDATTGLIGYWDNGVYVDAIAAGYLTSGHQHWPKALDPQDGHYATSQWPTMTSSVNAELLYWRRWL